MASPSSNPEASEIRRRGRQRLIGAVALVLLLVVFVPMLLDSEPRPSRETPAIPAKESAAPLPAPAAEVAPAKAAAPAPSASPVSPASPAQSASSAQAGAQAASPAQAGAQAVSPPPPVEPPPAAVKVEPAASASAAPAKPAPAAAAPAAAKAAPREGFAVQVGAFRDEAKLKQAREKLVSAGLRHYVEKLEVKSGPLTRLRVGPYPTREAAEAALVNVKRASLDGKVVPLP